RDIDKLGDARLLLLTLFHGGADAGLLALGGRFALLRTSRANLRAGNVHKLIRRELLFAIRTGLGRGVVRCPPFWRRHQSRFVTIGTPISPRGIFVTLPPRHVFAADAARLCGGTCYRLV